jgi:hypothetical protein
MLALRGLTFGACKIHREMPESTEVVPSTKKRVNHLHQVPEEDSITSQSYVVDFDPSRI